MEIPYQTRIGELLLKEQLITPEQLQQALERQSGTGKLLGEVLVDLGYITRHALFTAVAKQLGVAYYDLKKSPVLPWVARLLSSNLARRHRVLPVDIKDDRLILAMENPCDVVAQEEVRLATGREVEPVLADPEQLRAAIEQVYSVFENAEKAMARLQVKQTPLGEAATPGGDESGTPITKVVEGILHGAVYQNASDVHIEPQEKRLRVRYRINGSLEEVMSQPISLHPFIVTRIKVMANMDIAERRLPQDSRFTLIVDGRPCHFRVSTMPTEYGEKVVCRVFNKSATSVPLDALGMEPAVLARFQAILKSPFGMVLVTGPTGSGKSTTLAAALNYINTPDKNIVTVEDPVEYLIPGINQTQVSPRAGLTFSLALKHFLRQDPDIIMVGEIRDQETARTAITAALTGHLLLSTLHTNDAVSSLTRLRDMGIESFLIASSMRGILAQRLVRVLCPECKEEYEASPEMLERLGLALTTGTRFWRPVGCASCRYTGYQGRTGIFELMPVDEELRRAFLQGASDEELKRLAMQNGMQTIEQDGLQKARAGLTSLEEVLRVSRGSGA